MRDFGFRVGAAFLRCLCPPDPETEEEERNGKKGDFERSAASIGRKTEELFDEIHRRTSGVGAQEFRSLNSLLDG
jgi:hypothetical protein